MKAGNYKAAVIELKKVLELDPENLEAISQLAESYLKLQRLDNALYQYEKLIKVDSNNIDAYLQLPRAGAQL